MTETTQAQPDAEQPAEQEAQVEETTPREPNFPDQVSKITFDQIVGLTEQHNSLVGQLNAIKGDPLTLMESLRESSKDERVVEIRERLEKVRLQEQQLLDAMDKAIKPEYDKVRANAEARSTEIEAEVKTVAEKVRAATNYYKKMYEDLAEFLPKVERAKGAGRVGGSATGGRRIRGFGFTVTDPKADPQTAEYENVAQVAKALNVETETLQNGFFSAAGNPESSKDAPAKVEWTVTAGEGETQRTVTLVGHRKEDASSTPATMETEAPAEAEQASAE